MAFDIITPTKLGQVAVTTSTSVLYTVPALTRTILKEISAVNTTAGALTLTVYLVPSAGSPSAANAFYNASSIAANSRLQYNGTQVLNAGDTIQVLASGAGITVTTSGAECQ